MKRFFKNFSVQIILRVVLILCNMIAISLLWSDDRLFFNLLLLVLVLGLQVTLFLRYVYKTNKELARFILTLQHEDISVNFEASKAMDGFDSLYDAFENIKDQIKNSKQESKLQHLYLEKLIDHISIGIFTVIDNREIELMNPAAQNILQFKEDKNWKTLASHSPKLLNFVQQVSNEGQAIIETTVLGYQKSLLVNITSTLMRGKQYKIIAIKDIHSELEKNEFEAWLRLIRILTHEIMNSITPIASLSETLVSYLSDGKGIKRKEALNNSLIQDMHQASMTIQKRSDHLLNFVEDYRKISQVPEPNLKETGMLDLIQSIHPLFQKQLAEHHIDLNILIDKNETILLDSRLIEQVLINLIKNAIDAVAEAQQNKIEIALLPKQAGFQTLEVKDSGTGIAEEVLDKIFVPFFTTKPSGSGIGLSLSKQIMKKHGGKLLCKNNEWKGSSFQLVFKTST